MIPTPQPKKVPDKLQEVIRLHGALKQEKLRVQNFYPCFPNTFHILLLDSLTNPVVGETQKIRQLLAIQGLMVSPQNPIYPQKNQST